MISLAHASMGMLDTVSQGKLPELQLTIHYQYSISSEKFSVDSEVLLFLVCADTQEVVRTHFLSVMDAYFHDSGRISSGKQHLFLSKEHLICCIMSPLSCW